jgi:hypothetical protein
MALVSLRARISAAVVIFLATTAVAQENQPARVESKHDEKLMEEIIVKGRAWRLPDLGESKWREKAAEAPKSRMTFGYNAEEERDLRRDNPIFDRPSDDVKPATIFRFRF